MGDARIKSGVKEEISFAAAPASTPPQPWEAALEKGFFAEILDNFATMIDPQQEDEFLDVGCKTGALTRRLAGACRLAVGVDDSLGAVLRAGEICWNTHVVKVQFYHAPLTSLPLKLAHFNRCAAVNVLFTSPDPLEILREMARVTRPKGRIFLLEPSERLTEETMNHFIRQQGIAGHTALFMVEWSRQTALHKPLAAEKIKSLLSEAQFIMHDEKELMNGLALTIEAQKL
jgi:ubiquinone/menaquinone biosynthesis C-methylase UbiE